jgi:hypothetical protein
MTNAQPVTYNYNQLQLALDKFEVFDVEFTRLAKEHQLLVKNAEATAEAADAIPSWETVCLKIDGYTKDWAPDAKSKYLDTVSCDYQSTVTKTMQLACETQDAMGDSFTALDANFAEHSLSKRMIRRFQAVFIKETKEDARKAAAELAAKINAFPFIQYYSYHFFTGLKIF